MNFFSWLGGVMSDPNDKQGSTQRLCLVLLILMIVAVISGVTIKTGSLPAVPDSLSYLVCFLVTALIGGIAAAKGISAYKSISTKEVCDDGTAK